MSCWAGGRAPDTGGRAVAAAATGTGDGRAESVATRLPKWRPARRNSTPGPCTARHSLQKACLARGPVCRSDQQRPSAPRSLGTWTAGLRCYFRFAQSQLGRGDNPLPPTVGELCLWAQCFSNPGTFANYRAQVDKACTLLNLDRSAFSDPAVSCAKAAIRHRAPQPGPRPPPVTRKALVAMLPHVPEPQTRALFIIAFAMALRLPSEALLIRMGDPALAGDFRFTQEDPDRPVPTIVLFTTDGTVALHLSRRKHMPRPSVVRRACWCSTCKATCPVHAPRSLLCGVVPGAFPFAHLARPTAAGRVLPSPAVTRNLRRSAEAAGLPNAARITTRCLRRGHTETLRQSGGNLAAILRAGDWRSGAFKAYLDQPALEAAASGEGMALPAGADPRVAGHDPASAASQP